MIPDPQSYTGTFIFRYCGDVFDLLFAQHLFSCSPPKALPELLHFPSFFAPKIACPPKIQRNIVDQAFLVVWAPPRYFLGGVGLLYSGFWEA